MPNPGVWWINIKLTNGIQLVGEVQVSAGVWKFLLKSGVNEVVACCKESLISIISQG